MNRLINLFTLSVCLLLTVPFSGCSNDDDEPSGGDGSKYGTLTINGVKHDCYFEYHGNIPSFETKKSDVFFYTYLFDETGIQGGFGFEIPENELKKGDVTDCVYVTELFTHYTGPQSCSYLSGTVSVEEKSTNKIVVKFNNYKIEYEDYNSHIYTIDGKVIYTRQ